MSGISKLRQEEILIVKFIIGQTLGKFRKIEKKWWFVTRDLKIQKDTSLTILHGEKSENFYLKKLPIKLLSLLSQRIEVLS